MPINYPGPFEVRIFYTTNEPEAVNQHEVHLSCQMQLLGDPGDPFTDWYPYQHDGGTDLTLKACVDTFVLEMKKHLNTGSTIVSAELWEYAEQSFDAVFRSAYAIGVAGTSVVTTRDGGQVIWTWRTNNGGILKLDLRGTVNASGARVALPGTGDVAAMNTYMLSGNTPWIARDNGLPIAGMFFLPGQNEKAYKKLYR